MKIPTRQFSKKPLASAVMCSILGLSPAAFAATVDSVNEDNLSVPPVEGKTLVYTDTEGTASFGWIDPVNDFGNVGLGIAVYNEPFTAQNTYDFAGCIMAQPDRQLQAAPNNLNCQAPPDSGKRFKLKTTETNAPIDLVLDVSADDSDKLYRVIGKFSNLTDGTNSVDGDLNAFRFETGFGVGNAFTPSSADDGLSFGFADATTKLTIGDLGKSPGGLFGGSKVEGLPFFSTTVSAFVESVATSLDQDTTETDGAMPAPYANLFGDWRTLSAVPTGWFIDHDGNPANDSILLAWDNGTADTVEESGWQTFKKVFSPIVLVDTNGDDTPDTLADRWDPNSINFDPALAVDVLPLVDTLGEEDPDNNVPDAISLEQSTAAALYDGTFNVLIDGKAVTIDLFDQWVNKPVTVIDSTNSSLYATWFPDEGEDGLYQLASDSSWITLDEMNSLINNNADLERVAGYVQGPVEDLANVNINTTISVADTSSWPTCTSDGVDTNCTFTLRVTGLNDVVDVPEIPITPVEEEPTDPEVTASSSGGGTIFGCSAGAPGSPFDPVLPGMVLMALGGLWARKRLSNT
ncbi:choice-of-anchor F family protein [Marinobacter antarcticus]|nr:choice-of-anchor F family protein [Marinobacter antarcticus]